MKKIECEHGMNEKLQKIFKTSHVTVRRALRYESKSELANKIRTYALKNGGVIMTPSDSSK
jgi:DeoR/GlpR family transcriptional regulator of sugar metabolism